MNHTADPSMKQTAQAIDPRDAAPMQGDPVENALAEHSVAGANAAAHIEQSHIRYRTAAGPAVAQAAPAATARTLKAKDSTGRPQRANASEVSAWKKANKATVAETAKHFNLPPTIAKRYCAVA